MNKKGGGVGLVSGLIQLLGGMVLIWLLFIFYSSGALVGFAGSNGIIMLAIFLGLVWIITRKTK